MSSGRVKAPLRNLSEERDLYVWEVKLVEEGSPHHVEELYVVASYADHAVAHALQVAKNAAADVLTVEIPRYRLHSVGPVLDEERVFVAPEHEDKGG